MDAVAIIQLLNATLAIINAALPTMSGADQQTIAMLLAQSNAAADTLHEKVQDI